MWTWTATRHWHRVLATAGLLLATASLSGCLFGEKNKGTQRIKQMETPLPTGPAAQPKGTTGTTGNQTPTGATRTAGGTSDPSRRIGLSTGPVGPASPSSPVKNSNLPMPQTPVTLPTPPTPPTTKTDSKIQPIATNIPQSPIQQTSAIQPVAPVSGTSGPAPDTLPLPAPLTPAPVSMQGGDRQIRTKFQTDSPPRMDATESIQPVSRPASPR